MNWYLLRLGLDEENHQLSKKEMEKREIIRAIWGTLVEFSLLLAIITM